MNIPGEITQGDSLSWSDQIPLNPNPPYGSLNPATWTLKYAIRGAVNLDLTAVSGGDGWTTSVTSTQSATLTPGKYYWQAYCVDGSGNRITVGDGDLNIKVDLVQQAAGYDGRSLAKQIVDAIEAEIKARATGGYVIEYSIAGRSLRKESLSDLMKLRADWRAKYAREIRQSRINQGRGDPTAAFVQFRAINNNVPKTGW